MDFLDDERAGPAQGGRRRGRAPAAQRVRFDRGAWSSSGSRPRRRSSRSTRRTRPTTSRSAATGWRSGRSRRAPNVADLDRGRRVGNRADYQNLIRLCQMLNPVHFFAGYPVEPIDIHASVRHLDALWDLLTLADKPIHAYSLGRQRITDAIEMARHRPRHRRRRRSTASRRCSRSSTRARRSASTRRCSTGSSRCRPATRSS